MDQERLGVNHAMAHMTKRRSVTMHTRAHPVALELVLAGAERLPAALHRVVALPAAAVVDHALVWEVWQAPALGNARGSDTEHGQPAWMQCH